MSSTHRRVVIKLSGEALGGPGGAGLDAACLARFANEVTPAVRAGTGVGVVVGGGNFLRGAAFAQDGVDRVTADAMGMLATVMNGLAIRDRLRRSGLACEVMGAVAVPRACRAFDRDEAVALLDKGAVVVFVGGTGNPFFSTDSAASLRAAEIDADLVAKATKVDGVYDKDPKKHPGARRFQAISYDEVLRMDLAFMDAGSVILCRDRRIPIRVFDFTTPGTLSAVLAGEDVGTLISGRNHV